MHNSAAFKPASRIVSTSLKEPWPAETFGTTDQQVVSAMTEMLFSVTGKLYLHTSPMKDVHLKITGIIFFPICAKAYFCILV